MEGVLAHVRGGTRLNTYDFVDVVDTPNRLGWQVKSTKATTPVTWKRAKIPNSEALIAASRNSANGLQALGDAIIEFCNQHARESIATYGLTAIGYSRLILFDNGRVMYFERELCTEASPDLFNPGDFTWRWSTPKHTTKKEQLQALHGTHRTHGDKWWAWHGLGENQLHFSGEHHWWPSNRDPHAVVFTAPTEGERLTIEAFLEMLEEAR